MDNWIFISSPKRFRMDDWLKANQFIEFVQNNNVQVGDYIYLYTTAPVQKIEYKLIVDKINIPYEYGIDDYDYERETFYALGGDDYDEWRNNGGNLDDMMDGMGY